MVISMSYSFRKLSTKMNGPRLSNATCARPSASAALYFRGALTFQVFKHLSGERGSDAVLKRAAGLASQKATTVLSETMQTHSASASQPTSARSFPTRPRTSDEKPIRPKLPSVLSKQIANAQIIICQAAESLDHFVINQFHRFLEMWTRPKKG
jgi:hypothetical protein